LSDPDARYAYDLDLVRQNQDAGGGAAAGAARSSAGAGSRQTYQHGAGAYAGSFHDPFDVFRAFFGGVDPFSGGMAMGDEDMAFLFGMPSSRAGMMSPSAHLGADPWASHRAMVARTHAMAAQGFGGMSLFDELAMLSASGAATGGGWQTAPPGATSVSTQTQTTIVNGVRVTRTTRTVRHADGRVESQTSETTDRVGGGELNRGGGGSAVNVNTSRRQASGGAGGGVTDVTPAASNQGGLASWLGRSWF
jgi:hypothetical protein